MTNPQNLHRLMGGTFLHAKPRLCAQCRFRQVYEPWEGYCSARGRILSAARIGAKRGRCAVYEQADMPESLPIRQEGKS
jgi:hypothetical protein